MNKVIYGLTKYGEFMAILREKHGDTVQNLADILGVRAATVSKVEHGGASVPTKWAEIIKDHYALSKTSRRVLDACIEESQLKEGKGKGFTPFGKFIKKLKQERGLTNSQIAPLCGVKINSFSEVMYGKRPIPPHWGDAIKNGLALDEKQAFELSKAICASNSLRKSIDIKRGENVCSHRSDNIRKTAMDRLITKNIAENLEIAKKESRKENKPLNGDTKAKPSKRSPKNMRCAIEICKEFRLAKKAIDREQKGALVKACREKLDVSGRMARDYVTIALYGSDEAVDAVYNNKKTVGEVAKIVRGYKGNREKQNDLLSQHSTQRRFVKSEIQLEIYDACAKAIKEKYGASSKDINEILGLIQTNLPDDLKIKEGVVYEDD